MSEQAKNSEASPNSAVSLGALLKQNRIDRGLSVGEVAERLKLPARQIDAMESGSYKGLPEAVFIKGFLSSYARLLELDEIEIKQYFQQIFPAGNQECYIDSSKIESADLNFQDKSVRRYFPSWLVGVLIIVVIAGVVYAWQSKSTYESAKQAANASQEVSVKANAVSSVTASNIRIVPMNTNDRVSTSTNDGNHALAVNASEVATNSAVSGETLIIKLHNRSWLQVTDKENNTLIGRVVDGGTVQQFTGGAPYKVIIGYSPGASVQFGGKDVNIPQNRKRSVAITVGAN